MEVNSINKQNFNGLYIQGKARNIINNELKKMLMEDLQKHSGIGHKLAKIAWFGSNADIIVTKNDDVFIKNLKSGIITQVKHGSLMEKFLTALKAASKIA